MAEAVCPARPVGGAPARRMPCSDASTHREERGSKRRTSDGARPPKSLPVRQARGWCVRGHGLVGACTRARAVRAVSPALTSVEDEERRVALADLCECCTHPSCGSGLAARPLDGESGGIAAPRAHRPRARRPRADWAQVDWLTRHVSRPKEEGNAVDAGSLVDEALVLGGVLLELALQPLKQLCCRRTWLHLLRRSRCGAR